MILRIAISLLLLASAMLLTLNLDNHSQAPLPLDGLLGHFFDDEPREMTVQAPPLLNFSRANVIVAWGFMTGLGTLALLVSTQRAPASERENQARAAEIIVCLLTLICLSMLLPRLAKILSYGVVF